MLLKRASGRTGRRTGRYLLGIVRQPSLLLLAFGSCCRCTSFWPLRAVFTTALFTTLHTVAVKCAAHNVITDTGQVFNTTTAYKYHAVLLQTMTFTGDICGNFQTVCQAYTGNLTQCRVR